MQKILLLIPLALTSIFFSFPVFPQESEAIAIATYYPSPIGIYQTLRLYPTTPAPTCDDTQEGAMYYDDSTNQVRLCQENPTGVFSWQNISGYWTLSGTNLYPNDASWNVGIGTTTPQRQFVVAATTPTMTLKRSGTSDTGLGWAIYSSSTGNDFRISEYLDANWSTASDRLAISKGGNVGIGTTPVAVPTSVTTNALQVNNTLIFSPSTSSDYANEGALYYNSTDKRLKYHDGSGWKNLWGTTLTGEEKELVRMQSNGTDNVSTANPSDSSLRLNDVNCDDGYVLVGINVYPANACPLSCGIYAGKIISLEAVCSKLE